MPFEASFCVSEIESTAIESPALVRGGGTAFGVGLLIVIDTDAGLS
ncbi:MAG: hypothetical protein PSN37_02205 [Alphaproteobacteria bacterium]|nr:hypothetical protein [Alphaproteobacteria bacterium]